MKKGYDEILFNKLYKETKALRRKLASEINPRKFRVDYDEILSWFDVKFIFVFNKYCDKYPPDRLKGNIINALQTYKYRILRKSLNHEFSFEFEDVEDNNKLADLTQEIPDFDRDLMYNMAVSFIKQNLSTEAYTVFMVDMQPPAYIIERMSEEGKQAYSYTPAKYIAEYLGYTPTSSNINKISSYRNEIKELVAKGKDFFKANPQLLDNPPAQFSQP